MNSIRSRPAPGQTLTVAAGLSLVAAGALAQTMASEHMRAIGEICGASQPHCVWCFVAPALAGAGVAALLAAAGLDLRQIKAGDRRA